VVIAVIIGGLIVGALCCVCLIFSGPSSIASLPCCVLREWHSPLVHSQRVAFSDDEQMRTNKIVYIHTQSYRTHTETLPQQVKMQSSPFTMHFPAPDIFHTVMAPGHVPVQTRAYDAAKQTLAKGSSDLKKEIKNVNHFMRT